MRTHMHIHTYTHTNYNPEYHKIFTRGTLIFANTSSHSCFYIRLLWTKIKF